MHRRPGGLFRSVLFGVERLASPRTLPASSDARHGPIGLWRAALAEICTVDRSLQLIAWCPLQQAPREAAILFRMITLMTIDVLWADHGFIAEAQSVTSTPALGVWMRNHSKALP
jgi:hypothetical protein